MPIPDEPRVLYSRNPITEVICQLRFPTILTIATKPPSEFQERIRDPYVLYVNGGSSPFQKDLSEFLPGLILPITGDKNTHQFRTEDGANTISLTQDFVAIAQQRYADWNGFRREVERAELSVRTIYRPAFYTRIGLRYQNRINRTALSLDGHAWKELIRPAFAGLLAAESVKEEVQYMNSDVILRLNEIDAGRVRIQHGLSPEPPEQEQSYIIDSDLFAEGRYDHDDALAILDRLHSIAGRLFRWIITPTLANALGRRDDDDSVRQ